MILVVVVEVVEVVVSVDLVVEVVEVVVVGLVGMALVVGCETCVNEMIPQGVESTVVTKYDQGDGRGGERVREKGWWKREMCWECIGVCQSLGERGG